MRLFILLCVWGILNIWFPPDFRVSLEFPHLSVLLWSGLSAKARTLRLKAQVVREENPEVEENFYSFPYNELRATSDKRRPVFSAHSRKSV
jgi:hypothetical protein